MTQSINNPAERLQYSIADWYKPSDYKITIIQGEPFNKEFRFRDQDGNLWDLIDHEAHFMARTNVEAKIPFLTLSTMDGGIKLGGVNGTITLFMDADETSKIPIVNAIYDMEISKGNLHHIIHGSLFISDGV